MNKIKEYISDTEKLAIEKHFEKELKTFRTLLFVTVFAYPIFGLVNTFLQHSENITILIQRIIFSLSILICLGLSYKIEKIRSNFYFVITTYTYIGSFHLVYIGFVNGFSFSHTLGIIIVIIGTSFVYRRLSHLRNYILFNIIIICFSTYFAPENQLDKLTALIILLTTYIVIFFAMQLKARSQKIIKGNEANINALIENAEGIIWSVNTDFKYIAFNKSFENFIYKLTNKLPKIEQPILDKNINFELKKQFEKSYLKVLNGENDIIETKILMNDAINYFTFSLSPIKVDITKVIGITVFGNDITARKEQEIQLQKNQIQLNKAQEIAKLGSWTYDIKTKAFSISKEISSLFEIEHTPNSNFISLFNQNLDTEKKLSIKDLIDNKTIHDKIIQNEYLLTFPNGNKKWTRSIIDFSFNEFQNLTHINGVLQDITKEKNIEINLVKSKELADQLRDAKEQFMANMSHEIRTPLNGILGFTKVLLQNNNFSDEQLKQLNAIKSSGDILLVIINDILDLAKIESGKLSLEATPINLLAITRQAIDTFEVKVEEKRLNIHFTSSPTLPESIIGDSVRISQILLNLISNSIKFTPDNGSIDIQISCEPFNELKSKICFCIKDSGIGIPEDKLLSIFEPFIQTSDDTTRKFGGTGLGLSIVKKLVEMMKGKIYAESIIGEGTTFYVELILSNNTEISKEITIEENSNKFDFHPENIKILLAEDNYINQLLATTVLNQFGYQITCVENGKLAVEMVEKENFDLILMDLMMPEMDGYDASILIRKMENEVKKSIPIIALTADVTAVDIEKCFTVGMNNYVTKPFDPEDLNQKIAKVINDALKK